MQLVGSRVDKSLNAVFRHLVDVEEHGSAHGPRLGVEGKIVKRYVRKRKRLGTGGQKLPGTAVCPIHQPVEIRIMQEVLYRVEPLAYLIEIHRK